MKYVTPPYNMGEPNPQENEVNTKGKKVRMGTTRQGYPRNLQGGACGVG